MPKMPILAFLLALAAFPAVADILRWTDGVGRVHYGDRAHAPARGAEPRPDLAAPEALAAIGGTLDADAIEAARERARERSAALEAAHGELAGAKDALREAQARRASGVEPLPGERLGMAGGGSRLSPAYFERQALLEAREREARRRVDEALQRRNALR